MDNESKIRLRDRREPGHLWADNEIYDVFGDEIGDAGIGVYMTLARLCYGSSVSISLRKMGEHARMDKGRVARGVAALVRVGLVLETRPGKSRAVSTYSLTDVKALAREFVRQSVSLRDSGLAPAGSVSVCDSRDIGNEGVRHAKESICPSLRQTKTETPSGASAFDLSQNEAVCETDLSQKTQNLSQNGLALNKNKKQDKTIPPLTPVPGGERVLSADDQAFEAEQRGYFEMRNRIEARAGRAPLDWETWMAEAYRTRTAPALETVKTDAEFDACQTAEEAALLLMRRECIAQRRLTAVIACAIGLKASKTGLPVGEAGYLAWRNARSYAESSGIMRYSWGWAKFFGEGYVWNPAAWPRGEPVKARL